MACIMSLCKQDPRPVTCFTCLTGEGTICFVVVSQRSPATPPSILLASDTFPGDSGWKPSPVVGPNC